MTVVHSNPAQTAVRVHTPTTTADTTDRGESPILLSQALNEYTNLCQQQLEPHLAQQLAQALAAGCTWEECASTCRSLSEHGELFSGLTPQQTAPANPAGNLTEDAPTEDTAATQQQICDTAFAHADDPEEGASTAEYGIVMLAAVGFAGLLVAILKSDEVRGMLVDLVKNALAAGGAGFTFGLF